MSKIVRLTSENVKRLRAVDITPTGTLVAIGGNNGQGKSSVLDCIAMAIGGTDEVPEMPVHRGADKAKIVLELDDLIIRRTFTAAGGTALVVENKDGARYPSPQAMLDKLTGKLTFDPLEFSRLDPKKQAEALRKLVNVDFSALDAKRKQLYDDRTLTNRQHETAKAKADFMPQHADAPADEQSMTALVAERDEAIQHNATEASLKRLVNEAIGASEESKKGRIEVVDSIQRLEKQLASFRELLKEYDAKAPDFAARLAEAQGHLLAFVPTDVSAINVRLANAERVNTQVRQNAARAEAVREADAVKAKATALTTQIDEIDKQKADQLAAVKFPVEGLSFNESGVVFNDVPFSEASDAEKIRVSVAMGLALNPKLKVLLVRNGSLLDPLSLSLLTKLAAEADAQVWIEFVSTDAGKCSVIIEDGAVLSQPEAAAVA